MNDTTNSQLSQLSLIEKIGVTIGRLNEFDLFKRTQLWFCKNITSHIVLKLLGRRIYADNLAWIYDYNPQSGTLLAGNHRTFFDLWLTMSAFNKFNWLKQVTFPVRSNFFYDNPIGIWFNLMLGIGVMYPPIFRDLNKADWNKDAINRLINFLATPGSLLGFHPEGTRNKNPDPYTLLPAKSGIGEIILQAQPTVVPFFINGLTNNFIANIKLDKQKNARLSPVIMVFGNPIDYTHFLQMDKKRETYKLVGEHILDQIRDLIYRERKIRQDCESGKISPNDPGWLL